MLTPLPVPTININGQIQDYKMSYPITVSMFIAACFFQLLASQECSDIC